MLTAPRYHLLNGACGSGPINIFFAGSGFTYELAYDAGVRKRLLSWHANTEEDIEGYVKAQSDGRESFGICDSGAFTVWNRGGTIDVLEYSRKLVELLQHFDVSANLDVIPGRKGMAAAEITKKITEDAAAAGRRNYFTIIEFLKAQGIDATGRVMPIYHQGESMDWLKKMVDDGCDYIGVSPSNDYQTSQREHWLDDVYDYLLTLPKMPRTHGYAVTSPRLMKQYPWFSVDSASWIRIGAYGSVNTPFGLVTMTDRPEMMGKPGSFDAHEWSDEMREKAVKYFESIGTTIEKLKADFRERWSANAKFLVALEKEMIYKKKMKAMTLFGDVESQDYVDDNADY